MSRLLYIYILIKALFFFLLPCDTVIIVSLLFLSRFNDFPSKKWDRERGHFIFDLYSSTLYKYIWRNSRRERPMDVWGWSLVDFLRRSACKSTFYNLTLQSVSSGACTILTDWIDGSFPRLFSPPYIHMEKKFFFFTICNVGDGEKWRNAGNEWMIWR